MKQDLSLGVDATPTITKIMMLFTNSIYLSVRSGVNVSLYGCGRAMLLSGVTQSGENMTKIVN